MKHFLIILSMVLLPNLAHAEDFEVDAEQEIGDSEAAKEIARDNKAQLRRDRKEAAVKEREAVRMADKAKRKHEAAKEEIARNEKELKKLNERITFANTEIKKADRSIALDEAKLEASRKKLESTREQLKIADEEKRKREKHIGELKDKAMEAHKDIASSQEDLTKARADYKRRGLAELDAQKQLDVATKAQISEQAKSKQELEKLKSDYQKQREVTEAHKAKLKLHEERTRNAQEAREWAKDQIAKEKAKGNQARN